MMASGYFRSALSRWRRPVGLILVCIAFVLPIWAGYLGITLPSHFTARRWWLAWLGLDIMEAVALGATGVLALRRDRRVVPLAGAASGLLFADAWFDVLTSHNGIQSYLAIATACGLELPLSILCGLIAFAALRW
jgi:hypothetical protein